MRTTPPANRATVGVIAVAIGLTLGTIDSIQGFESRIFADRPGVCDREAEKLVDQKPVHVRGAVHAPKKIHDVKPKFPELPHGTVGSGVWIGEALIDNAGKVARVWTIRDVKLTPRFPAFNVAITDAIRQWEFEPVILNGKATPVCMTVTITIDWS